MGGFKFKQFMDTAQVTYNGKNAYKELEARRQDYIWVLRAIGKMQKRHPEWDWSWLYTPYGNAEHINLDKLNKVQRDLYYMRNTAKTNYDDVYFELKINHCI